jgi:hypothetical protein
LANQNFRVKNGLEVGTGATISSGGNITAGIISATSFVGSGSQLTGIVASGTVNYANISGVSSSVVGGAVSATSLSITGVSTFDGVVKIRNGYNLNIGDNNDLRIYNDGTDSRIEETGSGSLYISGSNINIQQHSTNENIAKFIGGGAVELYYNDNKKIETTGTGVTVTGTIVADQINLSGVATATTFIGSLTGNASSATYASNAGVATYASTAGISTVSQGLTGTPNIIVNNISSSGIVTIGTLSVDGESTLGTVKITSGIVTASSGIVTYYGDISNTVSGRLTLGASGTSDYTFTGIGFTQTTNDPTLYLKRGEVYEFVNNSGGSHPFQIRVSNGGAAYNNGVTNNGSATGTIRFEVPYNAPDYLYYQCTNHSSMGGDIHILGTRGVPQNAQTSAYILSASDVGKHISITTGGVTVNSGIFSPGDAVSIYNNSGSNQTITQGTSVTMYLVGTATTGNRTLAQRGVATVLCVGTDTFVIMGGGLT